MNSSDELSRLPTDFFSSNSGFDKGKYIIISLKFQANHYTKIYVLKFYCQVFSQEQQERLSPSL
jgi:hypothetical protein